MIVHIFRAQVDDITDFQMMNVGKGLAGALGATTSYTASALKQAVNAGTGLEDQGKVGCLSLDFVRWNVICTLLGYDESETCW